MDKKYNLANPKILYFESLRGIAAMLIAIFHCPFQSFLSDLYFFTNKAWLMVDFFFVLSGFVISLNYLDKIKSIGDLINFQFRRFLRLYPLHILILGFFLFLELVKLFLTYQFHFTFQNAPFVVNNWSTFFYNIFLLQIFADTLLNWNYASWSVSAEFVTYVLFALLILLSKNHKYFFYLFSIIIVLFSFICLEQKDANVNYSLLRCMYGFFVGVLVRPFYRIVHIPSFVSYLLFIILFLLLCVEKVSFSDASSPIFSLFFGLFIISLSNTHKNTFLKRGLSTRFLVYLGSISYGVYMIHILVWRVIILILSNIQILRDKFDLSPTASYFVESNNFFFTGFILFFGLFIIFSLSHFSYQILEIPINNYKHKLRKL